MINVRGYLAQGEGGVSESFFNNTDNPNDMIGNITIPNSGLLCNTVNGLVVLRDGKPYYVGANEARQASKYSLQ